MLWPSRRSLELNAARSRRPRGLPSAHHSKIAELRSLRRRLLVERSFEQARRFSWERTAQQVLDAYEEIGSYKKRPR